LGTFIRHISCDKCGSSDGNALYDDGSTYCWVCHVSAGGEKVKDSGHYLKKSEMKEPMEEVKQSKPVLTEEQKLEIKETTGFFTKNYRNIRDETYKAFGVRHSAFETGELAEQYYPITQEGALVGYKIRQLPKSFKSIGRTGSDCELFGQFKFKPGRYIVITEGEIDALSAYQMLKDYNHRKGWDQFETAVVSPTIGAMAVKQIAAHYKFLDKFEQIILCFDSDKAGEDAVEKLIPILPKGKVKIMSMRLKDANEYLKNSQEDAFIRDFYDAKKFMPVGVVGSSGIMQRIKEQASVPKIPFPSDLLPLLNEMIGGGMPLGHIANIAAKTGIGKTTMINEFVYYWIFHSPHRVGIVSMELDTGQYGEVLLSRHLRRKLARISDIPTKLALLDSPEIIEKANELFLNEDGTDRFYLLDNRDGSLEEIKETIEELVVSCGCKVIVLDPVQDLLAGLSVDAQEEFMQWMKGFMKSHGVTFILINHVRKTQSNDATFTEEDIQGSSTIIKSASINLLLYRDKTAEDPVERNTTRAMLSKNRVIGDTGPCGEMYYDNETHSLYNKQHYFEQIAPEKF
jgi:KaiC/GvpD/RAD55 family RecA-like ATPase